MTAQPDPGAPAAGAPGPVGIDAETDSAATGAAEPGTAGPDTAGPATAEPDAAVGSAPRRRPTRAELDRIFGVEPVSTRDDLPDPEVPAGRDRAEAWYLENRPPHHG